MVSDDPTQDLEEPSMIFGRYSTSVHLLGMKTRDRN